MNNLYLSSGTAIDIVENFAYALVGTSRIKSFAANLPDGMDGMFAYTATPDYDDGINFCVIGGTGIGSYGPGYYRLGSSVIASSLQVYRNGVQDPVARSLEFVAQTANLKTVSTRTQLTIKDPGTINVCDPPFNADPTGVADSTVAIQAAITACAAGGCVFIPFGTFKITDLQLASVTNISIRGAGRGSLLQMTADGAVDDLDHFGLHLTGTCSGIEICQLRITGLGTDTSRQTGIGSATGAVVSNWHTHHVEVDNVVTGISYNAYLVGLVDVGSIDHCYVHDIIGGVSGSGYGIHCPGATNVNIVDNTVQRCGRHSIYHGWTAPGTYSGNTIARNKILQHRAADYDGGYRCALAVSRSFGVDVQGNWFLNGYDGAIEISHDSTGFDCGDIFVHDNVFAGRQNDVGYIRVGEEAIPGTYLTRNVYIQRNQFFLDSATFDSVPVSLLNGTGIHITDNKIRRTLSNSASPRTLVNIGDARYGTTAAHCGDIECKRNHFEFSGSDTAQTIAVGIDGPPLLAQTPFALDSNRHIGVATQLLMTAPMVNTRQGQKTPETIFGSDLGLWCRSDVGGIASWTDRSVNVNHLIQASAGAQPSIVAATTPNRLQRAFRFGTGLDRFMGTANSVSSAQPVSVLMALKLIGNAHGQYYFSGTAGADNCAMYRSGSTNSLKLLSPSAGPVLAIGSVDRWSVVVAQFDGATSSLGADYGTPDTSGNTGANVMGTFWVGGNSTGYCANMDVSEVVVVKRLLTAAEIQDMLELMYGYAWGGS